MPVMKTGIEKNDEDGGHLWVRLDPGEQEQDEEAGHDTARHLLHLHPH